MSKELTVKDESESRWSVLMHKRLHEGLFILIFAFSLFTLLALVSYEITDLAKNRPHVAVSNAAGWVGAYLADALLLLFGFLAYVLPFIMSFLGWVRLYPERYLERDGESTVSQEIRWVGAILLLLSACGLASFEFNVPTSVLPHTAGGVIGDFFSKTLDVAFNPKGTVLLLVALFFTGITLLTGLSWISFSEKTGFYTLHYLHKVTVLLMLGMAWAKQKIAQYGTRNNDSNFSHNGAERTPERTPRINEAAASALSAMVDKPKVTMSSVFANAFERTPEKKPERPIEKVPEKSAVFSHSSLLNKVDPSSLPSLTLLEPAQKSTGLGYTSSQLESMAREVEQRLLDFGIEVHVVAVHPGPVITRFELQLAPGVKVSRISGLAKDLARSLSVISVRVVDVIPGKPVIGLELPNQHRDMVRLSEVFLTDQFQHARSPISLAMGVDISGHPVVVDLAKMPHMLVAGTTGSGKSVGLNAMLLSILFKSTPDDVRLILVDPKMLEFSIYDRIPHLLTPVVTDMKEAAGALRWCVAEMERRYQLMSALGLRNLAAYNQLIKDAEQKGESIKDPLWRSTQDSLEGPPFLGNLPYIVVVIDELADMMMVVGKKVEQLIARIAQKARAAGIHLILATQRPSVDVLTGLIKSNIPTRIAFQVSSKIDSRTILDQQGAEQLLGHGDMLYLTPGSGSPVRIHGAFVDDKEVHRVTDAWRERGDPQYVDVVLRNSWDGEGDGSGGDDDRSDGENADPLYDEAVRFVTETRKASISSVQRRLKVGYNRAARLIEEMERTGVISAMESNGVRDVLAPPPPED